MKTRRLLSLLLTVVMVLTVLPLAVFAWEAQSAVNLRVRINGRFYNPTTNRHEEISSNNWERDPWAYRGVWVTEGENPAYPVSYHFVKETYHQEGSSYNGKEGYKLVVMIGGEAGTDFDLWVFDRDMSEVAENNVYTFRPTYSSSSGAGEEFCTIHVHGGTPLEENPTPPERPYFSQLPQINVSIRCKNTDAVHNGSYFPLKSDSCLIGAVEGTAETGYTCTIRINSYSYIQDFNKTHNVTHSLYNNEPQYKSFQMTYDANAKEWKAESDHIVIDFNTICETPETKPEKPAFASLKDDLSVVIQCVNEDFPHSFPYRTCTLREESLTIGEVTGSNATGYKCDVTVAASRTSTRTTSATSRATSIRWQTANPAPAPSPSPTIQPAINGSLPKATRPSPSMCAATRRAATPATRRRSSSARH